MKTERSFWATVLLGISTAATTIAGDWLPTSQTNLEAVLSTAPGGHAAPPECKPGFLEDVTWSANASYENYPRGGRCKAAVFEDFDGDGLLDLYLGTSKGGAQEGSLPNILYLNQGDGIFKLGEGECRRPEGKRSAYGIVYADFNGDGQGDLFIASGHDLPFTSNVLLMGPFKGGRFALECGAAAGLGGTTDEKWGCAAADVDGDGWVDLLVGGPGPAVLYRNINGKFADVTAAAGLAGVTGVHGCTFADVDGDGDADLYAGSLDRKSKEGRDRLFINDGKGHFVDESLARGILQPVHGCEIAFFDFDNDGDLDLFVARDDDGVDQTAARYRSGWLLYENDGSGHFRDVTPPEFKVTDIVIRACRAGDLNNDGRMDLVVGLGAINRVSNEPRFDNVFLGDGRGRFTEVGRLTDVGRNGGGHGLALGDIDNDGDLDIYLAVFGFGERAHLYRNHSNNDAWLKVKLAGSKPNTSAIGARIYAYKAGQINDSKALLGLRVVTGAHGGYGGGPLLQHFGLGDARRVDLKVVWPNGATTVRKDIANAATVVIPQEGADPVPVAVGP